MSTSRSAPASRAPIRLLAFGLGAAVLATAAIAPAAGAANAKTKRIAIKPNGVQANATSWNPATSANGRFVAFESEASNLVFGDKNEETDIFVRDRKKNKTRRVSVTSKGKEAIGGESDEPSISGNGRFVAFASAAKNLIGNDKNGLYDIFVRDRKTGKTKRVSIPSGGGEAIGGDSRAPSISGDGRFVAFESRATNLVGNDTNNKQDIFVHDRWKKTTRRVNVKNGGGQALGEDSYGVRISRNGSFIAFWTNADNLVHGDENGRADVFVHNRTKRKTKRVSIRTDGGEALNGGSSDIAISADGRYVVFASFAKNLVNGDDNGQTDIFIRDRANRTTKRISRRNAGGETTAGSYDTSISANGRYVAFAYDGQDLVNNDANPTTDVFVYDRKKKRAKLVSKKTNGGHPPGGAESASLSADGRFVAFESEAALVGNDTNTYEVFIRGPLR